jgi:hypothetical protein
MSQHSISTRVYDLDQEYKTQSTKILEGLERDQWEIIQRVYHYKNDQFTECTDPNAIFWNVVSKFLPHYAKLLDIDAKDIRPKGRGETNFFQAWILRRKLHNWFDQKGKLSGDDFGVFIDDLTKNVASFGSYIVKINNKTDEPEFVDLRNIRFDPKVKTIRGKEKAEFHYMSDGEIRKKDAWDDHEELINKSKEVDGDNEIWEYFGEVKDGNDWVFKHVIGAGQGDKEVIAFEEEIDPEDDPYYDVHLGQYEGMWLRRGIYEKCFPEQVRANEIVNQNAQATAIASLLLMRSNDGQTHGNVLQKALSGQIIQSKDLQQIDIDNKAFTDLLNELEVIEAQVREKLGLPDVATGETLPSGTPFRGMALLSSAQKSAFKQTRSRVATGIVNIVEEIVPRLVEDWNSGDMVEIAEDQRDMEMYDEAIRRVVKKRVYQKANEKNKKVPKDIDERIEEMVDEKVRRKGRKIEVPKGFFNFDYGFAIDPVGEFIDKGQQNDAIINALQLIMQMPEITEIPIFNQLLENNNIPPFKIKKEVKEKIKQRRLEGQGNEQAIQQALQGLNPEATPNPQQENNENA